VADCLGITRQGAHKHLRSLVDAGVLTLEGKGRGSRYRLTRTDRPDAQRFTYPIEGLEESAVWEDLTRRSAAIAALSGDARATFQYALTELVNNAIDHSGSSDVEVEVDAGADTLAIEVVDRGVGIFEHIRQRLGLASELEALQELSKGKTTTMPSRHTGEGLFFVSKAADCFEVESGRLRWIVDNAVDDMAASEMAPRVGTRARFEAAPAAARDLRQLFEAYTEDYEFVRTRTVIRLFAIGVRFVSRSEAKRLVHNLERFREVVLDFKGVEGVGQGFADEVFRVWHREHPEVRLIAVNMRDPVQFMVERARRAARSPV
jgi:anti-sigma regulatory factor (Ser/Thr protein kinase)